MRYAPYILIILFLSGCVVSYDSSLSDEEVSIMDECMDSNPERFIEEKDSKTIEASVKDVCYEILARQTKNPDHCSLIKNNALADSCYYDFAVSMKNIELCNEIKGASIVDCKTLVRLRPLTSEEMYDYEN